MATYLILFSFTEQGIETIKDLPARVKAAKESIHKLGGETRSFYAILGSEFDTLCIVNAPSDEKIAEMALAIAKLGNVRTRTHRLFNEEEIGKITAALAS